MDVLAPYTTQYQHPFSYFRTFQWSDDEEDTKRVVRSEKEKRWEEMKGIIKTMKNHKNIKDMPSIQSGVK